MNNIIRWGVLGCARIALNHVVPAILEADNAQPYAIASRELDKAQKAAADFGFEKAYGDYQSLLDDPGWTRCTSAAQRLTQGMDPEGRPGWKACAVRKAHGLTARIA